MSRILRASLIGAACVAVLDIAGAMVLAFARSGAEPLTVLQSVASGALGKSAYSGGITTALIGLAIHTGIALVAATVFMLVASRVPALTRRPWLWGPVHGLGVWAVMYLIVLPQRWPQAFPNFEPGQLAGQLFCHLFLVGLPIGIVASRVLGSRDRVD
jgi:hypothetical protein